MKLALVAICTVACSASLTAVENTATSSDGTVGWYDRDGSGVPYWDARSTYDTTHVRFPRQGDKVTIPADASVSFDAADTPTSYIGAVQGEYLIIEEDGTLIIEEGDDTNKFVIDDGSATAPVHCHVPGWNSYSTCSKSCGGGSMTRDRDLVYPTFGGDECPHKYETAPCNTHKCAEHCHMSAFSAWSTCSKSCVEGGSTVGSQTRSRSIISAAAYGGYACPYMQEQRTCNSQACPIDCEVGGWSGFTECTNKCNGGTYSKSRSVTQPAIHGGAPCQHLIETHPCNTQSCPVECSHTKCKYLYRNNEWKTVVMHSPCKEQNGLDYHCEHHFGTQQITVLGGAQFTHTDECKCYCDFEGHSSIAHRHIEGDSSTNLVNSAHAMLLRRVRSMGNSRLTCA